MRQRAFGFTFALVVLSLVTSSFASAQGGSLSGVVVDTNGGVIPGASVVVKNKATGTSFDAITNAEGLFSVPALDPGTYTVTVSLSGFKTGVLNDVRIAPGIPNSVKAALEVGSISETVDVTSSSEIINTQTATISSTLNVDQINQMPLPSRNALNAVTFLPGVDTPTTNRNSTINGLPESFINITLDGITNSDNFNKSTDGFFASVTPRQDAIEAVTVTTAVGGADIGGSGAVAINFATRSGTDRFTGSLYEYLRHPDLNSNTWFNERNSLRKNEVRLNQYGGGVGGPIVVPGVYDGRGKAFYFVNYEQLRLPNDFSRSRTVLHPRAQQGWFRYLVGSEIREVNVLHLAAANGHISTIDPMVTRLLGQINPAMETSGANTATSDPLLNSYVWQSPGEQFEHQPVVRIDYNVSSKHRLSASSNMVMVTRDPDLQANNAAGGSRSGSFAYFGPGTGTHALPIYLAYLNDSRNANDPAAYTGGTQTWTSPALAQRLVRTNPSPIDSAEDLDGNLGRRQMALGAGLPANFFVVNPDIDDVNITDSGAFSDYHALQIHLRRRLSHGLQIDGSYQYAVEGTSAFRGFSFGREKTRRRTCGMRSKHSGTGSCRWGMGSDLAAV